MGKPNWANQTIWTGDNLDIMRGMNSECVDLVYLDPPFNSNATYAAPVGSKAAGAGFKDMWTFDEIDLEGIRQTKHKHKGLYGLLITSRFTHGDSMASYLFAMAKRLLEVHRLLKPTGSVYLHCDPTASHYLKVVMDEIFGAGNFRNEISWKRHTSFAKGSQHLPKTWGSNTDIIFYYAKSQDTPLKPYRELTEVEARSQFPKTDEHGERYYDDSSHIWSSPNMGARPTLCYDWSPPDMPGVVFRNPHPSGWRLAKKRMDEEYEKGNFVVKPNGRLQRRKYERDFRGKQMGNFWDDINPAIGKERTGYPTQKPIRLLERIIDASSDEGDMVLDPFCGCATACHAAHRLGRKWAGIDLSPKAVELVVERLENDEQQMIHRFDVTPRTDIPKRTDLGRVRKYSNPKNKKILYGEQGGYCNGCGEHFNPRNLTIDHIIPQSRGGTDHLSNLQLLCNACNSKKGTGTQEELLAELSHVKIPRY